MVAVSAKAAAITASADIAARDALYFLSDEFFNSIPIILLIAFFSRDVMNIAAKARTRPVKQTWGIRKIPINEAQRKNRTSFHHFFCFDMTNLLLNVSFKLSIYF